MNYLSIEEYHHLLNKEDLTENKKHCINLVIEKIKKVLENYYQISGAIENGNKVVSLLIITIL